MMQKEYPPLYSIYGSASSFMESELSQSARGSPALSPHRLSNSTGAGFPVVQRTPSKGLIQRTPSKSLIPAHLTAHLQSQLGDRAGSSASLASAEAGSAASAPTTAPTTPRRRQRRRRGNGNNAPQPALVPAHSLHGIPTHGPLYYTTLGSSKYHTREYMKRRIQAVHNHFPNSLGIDDFMHRVEIALYQNGFSGENSIAMSNLCRDEICICLMDKIDTIFGWSFNTVGVGAVLTCGVTGVTAGLSHSPVEAAKERYVFFSMPHIAIDTKGTIGAIERPGRAEESCACGALHKILKTFKSEGVDSALMPEMMFQEDDPEFSILRTRLAKKIKASGKDAAKMTLVDLTKECERMISADLEELIKKAVNTKNADYAVITGVQIHNWATAEDSSGAPNLEFIQPVSTYVVVDGVKKNIHLAHIPPMTPRQTRLLAREDIVRRAGWGLDHM